MVCRQVLAARPDCAILECFAGGNIVKYLLAAAKLAVSLLIIGYLFWSAISKDHGKSLFQLLAQPKRWDILLGGLTVIVAAILITIFRWRYLVRAIGIPLSNHDGLRIGLLAYLFNLAPLGIVGGDLLKAVMLAREYPGNRAKSLASVLVDRIVGLEVLFLISSGSVFLGGFWQNPDPVVHWVCRAVLGVTIVSTAGLFVCLATPILDGPWFGLIQRVPKIGSAIGSLLEAVRLYRQRPVVLAISGLMTVPVHVLIALGIFLFAHGLQFHDMPPSADFPAIYAVSGILGTIPLPAGPTETGIVYLYKVALVSATHGSLATELADQQGFILALAYRLSTFVLIPVALGYYLLGGRREVAEVVEADASTLT
jgi:hypothetical protein